MIALYDQLLGSIGQRAGEITPRPLVSHWPHVGTAYDGLPGRGTNGARRVATVAVA